MTAKPLPLLCAALIAAVTVARGDDRTDKSTRRISGEQFVALQKSKPKTGDKSSDTKKPRKFRGRLPAYYGQIGLSEKQRKQIYSIQLSYREKLLALEKQLRDLREKQSTEIDAVLNSDQKKKLADVLEAARKKRAARSKKVPKSDSKKTDKAAN